MAEQKQDSQKLAELEQQAQEPTIEPETQEPETGTGIASVESDGSAKGVTEVKELIAGTQKLLADSQKAVAAAGITPELAQAFLTHSVALADLETELEQARIAEFRIQLTQDVQTLVQALPIAVTKFYYSVDRDETTKMVTTACKLNSEVDAMFTKKKAGTGRAGGGKQVQWRSSVTQEVHPAKTLYWRHYAGTVDGSATACTWSRVLDQLHAKDMAQEWTAVS